MTELTIQQILQAGAQTLSMVTAEASLEAELLLAHVLKKDRSYLRAWPTQLIAPSMNQDFLGCLSRRLKKEPLAYITGKREFWSISLEVNQHTLIPRPETELVVEWALTLFSGSEKTKVADLGTGSGAIALALASERSNWEILATDVSADALAQAKYNAGKLGLNQVSFAEGNWCEALPNGVEWDLIVSNPPYIAETEWPIYQADLSFEPKGALLSGKEGLDAIRKISQSAKNHLKPGGYLIIEHGFAQGQAVREIFAVANYQSIHTKCDLAGHERITFGRYYP